MRYSSFVSRLVIYYKMTRFKRNLYCQKPHFIDVLFTHLILFPVSYKKSQKSKTIDLELYIAKVLGRWRSRYRSYRIKKATRKYPVWGRSKYTQARGSNESSPPKTAGVSFVYIGSEESDKGSDKRRSGQVRDYTVAGVRFFNTVLSCRALKATELSPVGRVT